MWCRFWRQKPGPGSGGRGGDCCVWRPGHVWSGFQIIVHVWCTNERVLNTICRFESGDDPAERTAWTREISATAAETRKGSLKMLSHAGSAGLACRCSVHIWAVTVSFRDLRSLTQVSHISPPARSHNLQAARSKNKSNNSLTSSTGLYFKLIISSAIVLE